MKCDAIHGGGERFGTREGFLARYNRMAIGSGSPISRVLSLNGENLSFFIVSYPVLYCTKQFQEKKKENLEIDVMLVCLS